MPRARSKTADGVLTVNDIARLAGVSNPTAIRWIDKGLIHNCWILPGSRERRAPAPDVLAFLLSRNAPVTHELHNLSTVFLTRFPTHPTGTYEPT